MSVPVHPARGCLCAGVHWGFWELELLGTMLSAVQIQQKWGKQTSPLWAANII